jgi:hypothetical protein
MDNIKKRAILAIAVIFSLLFTGLAGIVGARPGAPLSLRASEGEDGAGAREFVPWWDFGWGFRRTVAINNAGGPELSGYQVWFPVAYDSDMRSDFSDLRFVQYNSTSSQNFELPYFVENCTSGSKADVWVKVDRIPAGSGTIYMYYGNPAAASKSSSANTFEFFDDFEDGTLNKWTVALGGSYSVDSSSFAPNKVMKSATFTNTAEPKDVIITKNVAVTNLVIEYKARKDSGTDFGALAWYDASAQFYLFYCHNAILRWASSTWTTVIKGTDYTTTNAWMDIKFVGYNGALTGYVNGNLAVTMGSLTTFNGPSGFRKGSSGNDYIDNFRVRKYSSPEPQAGSIGDEERPFKFISMSSSPSRCNIGDPVFFNATFNNPTPDAIKVGLSACDADDFANATEFFYQEEVTLSPNSDTTFPFTWTAVGGPHTIWLSVFGFALDFAKIKVNRPPVIAPVKDQSLWEDRDFLIQLNASDPDGDSLTWSIDNALFNISPVSNRSAEMTFLPTNDFIGVHRVNITVRDTLNRTDTRRINFTVNNVNDPPALAKIPSLSATQYKELRYQAKATDVDVRWGDILTFSDNTDLFDIDAKTGEFFFTPVEEQVGKHNVKVTVADSAGASETTSFTITVANVNDPPALEMLPPQFTLQGRLFQLKIVAADPDLGSDTTEKLAYSDDSTLFNINNGSGLISFTPTNDQLGVWRANITVTDKGGLSNTTRLTITIMNANDPPALEAIPPQTATEGMPFTYQLTATDPDMKWGLDNLTFSDDTELFNTDPKTGAIAFTPTGAQAGIKRVTITVKDEKGASASASFDLTVVHVNHAPYDAVIKYPVDGAKLKEGDAMWLEGTARDTDKGDTLQYSWLDNGEPVGTGRNISVKLKPGTHAIKLEVSDGSETVSSEITVRVEKKEIVTVSGGGTDWFPLALALAAVIAIVAVVAVVAARRRKRQEEPEPSEESRIDSVPEGEDVALPIVPPAEAGMGGEEAQAIIDSTLDKMADYQEAHPEEVLDVAPVMEKLDIARDMLRSGSNDDALDFAMEASAEADAIMAPKAPPAPAPPKKVAIKKKKAIAVQGGKAAAKKDEAPASAFVKCPGCGEELDGSWSVCPACGHKMR